jgi:NAD(P)-dependent dehydrogenase (short-subunit alcohol dehydrogenase family)
LPAWARQPARGMNTIAYNTSKGAVINFTRIAGL